MLQIEAPLAERVKVMLDKLDRASDEPFRLNLDCHQETRFSMSDAMEAAKIIRSLAGLEAGGVAPNDIQVDVDQRTVVRSGVTCKVTPLQAAFLNALVQAMPNTVSTRKLFEAAYGKSDKSINTMRVILTNLKARIKPLGIAIINHHGVGYRLELLPFEGAQS